MATPILNARDVISGEQGSVWATINGERVCLMHVKNISLEVSYNKDEIPILGKRGKGHKKTGESYSGSMTVYYLTSIFRELAQEYKNSGLDFYFDLQIENSDSTSRAGNQIITATGVNLDNMILAKLDADAQHLEEDMDFTFEDWGLDKAFNRLDGLI